MDSTNLHHQQQHHHHHVHENHQLVESSANSSPSLSSSCFSVAENDHNAWRTPSFFLNNNGNIHASCDDNNEAAPISLNNPLIQDPQMGFIWPNNISINQSSSQQVDHHHHHQLIADNIKEEQPSSSTTSSDQHHHHHHHHQHDSCNNFMKFSDLLSSSSSTSEMLLLENTLSTSYKNHMLSNSGDLQHSPFQASMHYQNTNKGISTTFSQIFPSVNISNISNNAHNNNNNNNNMSSPMSSGSSTIDQMANNVQPCGFDLFATARLLGGEISLNNHPAPSNNNNNNNLLELFEGSPRFSVEHDLQQSNELKRCNNIPNNISSFDNNGGQAESKNYIMEQKSAHQLTNKKPRIESRSSCPPFKVRKEKLGDRIAALQQLVSPFGKTDTASVLMEAIGYIKFLQNQVETLSVPYMKLASRSKSSNTQRVSDEEYCESDEQKLPDLRSRGLCLVPTSCMSYINIANDPINGGIWPPPNFNPSGGF